MDMFRYKSTKLEHLNIYEILFNLDNGICKFCNSTAFICCSYCNENLCFEDFFIKYHYH